MIMISTQNKIKAGTSIHTSFLKSRKDTHKRQSDAQREREREREIQDTIVGNSVISGTKQARRRHSSKTTPYFRVNSKYKLLTI